LSHDLPFIHVILSQRFPTCERCARFGAPELKDLLITRYCVIAAQVSDAQENLH
jgi:hypothetical protein